MFNWQRICFLASTFLATLTGLAFLYMKYFLPPQTEFSIINHPWQPYLLKAHIITASVMLFFLGTLLVNHIVPYLQKGMQKGRRTGLTNVAIVPIMVFSGYLIQILTAQSSRQWAADIHIYSSLLFVVIFIAHEFRTKSRPIWQIVTATLGLFVASWALSL